jgi:DNA-binding winged helix-turn-helix (wHTH) protein
MARNAGHFCYEFGGFRLDPGRRILTAATTEERLTVPPRVVDIALYLVQRPGELVSKERLLSDLWPGQVVEENNLTQGISQLRRAFGEQRGENRYIVTVPRRGYRFVADVVRVTSGEKRCVLHDRAIAVLPFASPGGDVADEVLAIGVTASIQHALAELVDFTVMARAPTLACHGVPTEMREIASQLDSLHIVTGTCRRSGARLRITAQLIDAAEGAYVWSQIFDRTSCNAFEIEDDVAREVVRAIRTRTGSVLDAEAIQGETTGSRKSLFSAASVTGSRP